MKVALVSSGSGSRGGGEIYLSLLAKGLKALGCQVEALVPDAPRMDELAAMLAADAHVQRFAYTATYDRRSRLIGALGDRRQQHAVADLLRNLGPDIVHINQQVAEDGLDLLLAAQASGIPWLSTIHVGHSARALEAKFGAIRDAFVRRLLNRLEGTHIAVSDASRQQLVERFPEIAGAFHTVRNGVNAPDVASLAQHRLAARADWAVAEDTIVIGAVGRIEAQKNPLGFLDAIRGIGATRKIVAVWIGDGALRAELERAAQSLPDTMRLMIDGWRDDAARRMAGFDVFFLPSKFEGLPLAVLEAMHAGLPVVASRSDGLVEAIEDGEIGFLCQSAQEMSARLAALVDDDGLRKRIGMAAQAKARACFTEAEMARQTRTIYENVLAGPCA